MSWKHKLATVMSEKADVSSVSPSLDRSDEGLTLETSAFSLSMVANFCFQLSCSHLMTCYTLPPTQHHSFLRNLSPSPRKDRPRVLGAFRKRVLRSAASFTVTATQRNNKVRSRKIANNDGLGRWSRIDRNRKWRNEEFKLNFTRYSLPRLSQPFNDQSC